MPLVAATQPLNALAFVLDGVLYGVGGFKYASAVMAICAAPALGVMFLGLGLHRTHTPTAFHPNPNFGPVNHAGLGFSERVLLNPDRMGISTRGVNPGLGFSGGFGQFGSGLASSVEGGLGSDKEFWQVLGGWVTTHLPGVLGGVLGDQTQVELRPTQPRLSSAQFGQLQLMGAMPEAGGRGGGGGAAVMSAGAGADAGRGGRSKEGEGKGGGEGLDLLWWTWGGLVVLMAMRALTIYVPYQLR